MALAGVIGDGRPFAEPTSLSFFGIVRGLSTGSGGSLLGAGVRLLLGRRAAALLDKGNFESLRRGRPSCEAGVDDGFFWKNPVMDF